MTTLTSTPATTTPAYPRRWAAAHRDDDRCLREVFTGKERGAAFGIYGAMGGVAVAAGLLLGGVLTSADILGLGWRTVFFVNVPFALAAAIAALAVVQRGRVHHGGPVGPAGGQAEPQDPGDRRPDDDGGGDVRAC